MLRYFYLIICIQLCLSTDYTDHSNIYNFERKIRSKNARLHKKTTSSPDIKPKKSRIVQFDMDNFMRGPDEADNEYEPYSYRDKRRYDRRASEKYGDEEPYIESPENIRTKTKLIDYSIDENASEVTTRASAKEPHGKQHFNMHPISFDEKSDGKSVHNQQKSANIYRRKFPVQKNAHPEAKCSFKSMKIPFFSYNKSTMKPNHREKKKRMFCFNCHKTTTNSNQLESNPDVKADDRDQTSKDKVEKREYNKVSKRSYGNYCPKCIRDLLNSLKRNKKKKLTTTSTTASLPPIRLKDLKSTVSTTRAVQHTILDKAENMDPNLQGDYYYLNNIRKKRNELEDRERERRIKELEEVERKIENVHVTAPTFARVSLNIQN